MPPGCGSSRAPAPQPAPPQRSDERPARADLEATLSALAEGALQEGDLALAERRYRRILRFAPQAVSGHVGLGKLALARRQPAAAREHFRTALGIDSSSVEAWIGLADAEEAEHPEAASKALQQAIGLDPRRSEVHLRLARITGPAPPSSAPVSLDEALALAERHPYDPRALLLAAERLVEADRADSAVVLLEKAVWLADRDLPHAEAALRLLPTLSSEWRTRRVVRVHVYADQLLRSDPAWRFQQRTLWLGVSRAFGPILDTRFVPVRFGGFRSDGAGRELQAIQKAFFRSAGRLSPHGLLAAFTGQPMPNRPGPARRGQAEYLGRTLLVRLQPGEPDSRVLLHELGHIYGGVHVADEVESLMNASGEARKLDRYNARVMRALRGRGFGPGGFGPNVLTRVELNETIAAFREALTLNLSFRRLGLAKIVDDPELSRYHAAQRARHVTLLDPHLADVSSMVAELLWHDGRRVESVALLETAAKLYGTRSRSGSAAQRRADARRALLRAELSP